MTKWLSAGVLVLATVIAARAAERLPMEVPDKAATRGKIDALIGKFREGKKKATLGMVQESIDLSISYGAPEWNTGDHQGCCDFYEQTAKSLADAFGQDATPSAAAAIADLSAALGRTKGSLDVDRNAWVLRFAFDKTQLACDSEAVHASGLLDLGDQYLKRAEFDEAEDAFAAALEMLSDMDGRASEKIPVSLRFAPLASANALLGQKKFREAAEAARKGLEVFPEWVGAKVDLRTAFGDPFVFRALLDDLKGEVAKRPQDAGLHFLLGYEYFYTGQKEAAKALFEETLKLDPTHTGAKRMLEPAKEGTTTQPGPRLQA